MKKFIFCLITILFQLIPAFSLADVIMPGMDPKNHGMRVIELEPMPETILPILLRWFLILMTIIVIISLVALIITKIKNNKK